MVGDERSLLPESWREGPARYEEPDEDYLWLRDHEECGDRRGELRVDLVDISRPTSLTLSARRSNGELRPVRDPQSGWNCSCFAPAHSPAQYLYLLFNDPSSEPLTNRVFNTEGHPLSLPIAHLRSPPPARRSLHRNENAFCPVYGPAKLGGGLVVGIEKRPDYEYARQLVFGPGEDGRVIEDQDSIGWWEGGFCPIPSVPRYASPPTFLVQ